MGNDTRKCILIATKNRHKAEELAALAAPLAPGGLHTISLTDWENDKGLVLAEPEEGAASFVENALLKAHYYADKTQLPALADDSGLMVEALGGPGVLSARYGGPGLNDQQRYELILTNLAGQHDRRAYFTSVLALAKPGSGGLYWTGRADGLISRKPQGLNGFGYDPVFYYPPAKKTMAELTPEEKNSVSHRARAALAFKKDLDRVQRFLRS